MSMLKSSTLFWWGVGEKQVQYMGQQKVCARSLSSLGDCSLCPHVKEELDRLWQGENDDNAVESILDCIHHLRDRRPNSISIQEKVSILSKLRRNKSLDQYDEAQAMKIWSTLQVRSIIPRYHVRHFHEEY